jgi:hypothetical protein
MADAYALDPFSTVVRLALLPYMPRGVKIGIVNNSIVYFHPTVWHLMWRTLISFVNKGCTKHALYNLRLPFERAIQWYYTAAPELFHMARAGLRLLSENYQQDPSSGNVTATIASIICLLDDPDAVPTEDLSDKPTLARLQRCWRSDEIQAVASHAALLTHTKDSAFIVKCVDDFIRGKEPGIFDIIRESPLRPASSGQAGAEDVDRIPTVA